VVEFALAPYAGGVVIFGCGTGRPRWNKRWLSEDT